MSPLSKIVCVCVFGYGHVLAGRRASVCVRCYDVWIMQRSCRNYLRAICIVRVSLKNLLIHGIVLLGFGVIERMAKRIDSTFNLLMLQQILSVTFFLCFVAYSTLMVIIFYEISHRFSPKFWKLSLGTVQFIFCVVELEPTRKRTDTDVPDVFLGDVVSSIRVLLRRSMFTWRGIFYTFIS